MKMPEAFAARVNEWTGLVGVYLLCLRDEVIYVGQSIDVPRRIASHRRDKDYDRAFWIPVAKDDLDLYESVLIRFFQPEYNSTHYCNYFGDDNAILIKLGLEPYADEAEVERAYRQGFHECRSAIMKRANAYRIGIPCPRRSYP